MFQLFKKDLRLWCWSWKTFGCDIFYVHYKATLILLYIN